MRTVPPPVKMDKTLFDRCGNCTRAFGFLSRKRHCANCGFVYCSDCCVEKFKLLKFQGSDSRDVRVCDYCKEFLKKPILIRCATVDRMPMQVLTSTSVRSLREYIEAYGIARHMPFLEKSDLIKTILESEITEYNEEIFRQSTPGFRDWYKRRARNDPPEEVPFIASTFTTRSPTTPIAVDDPPSGSATGNRSTSGPPHPWASNSSSMDTIHPDVVPIERVRRPYSGSPQNPPVRPRSEGAISDDLDSLHLTPEEVVPERRRRQYSFSTREPPVPIPPASPRAASHSPPISTSPPTTTTATTDLRKLADEGIDIATLSTTTLLGIMRANNCPRPSGAIEKEDLIDRVEEMVSFVIANPQPTQEKQPKVRDEDEDDCRICYERLADYCLVPCGHTGFCFLCARKMEECPFCKAKIGHAQKLWKV